MCVCVYIYIYMFTIHVTMLVVFAGRPAKRTDLLGAADLSQRNHSRRDT